MNKKESRKKKKRGVFVLEDFTACLLRKPMYKKVKWVFQICVVFFFFRSVCDVSKMKKN